MLPRCLADDDPFYLEDGSEEQGQLAPPQRKRDHISGQASFYYHHPALVIIWHTLIQNRMRSAVRWNGWHSRCMQSRAIWSSGATLRHQAPGTDG